FLFVFFIGIVIGALICSVFWWQLTKKAVKVSYDRGYADGFRNGHSDGLTEGTSIGYEDGREAGLAEGLEIQANAAVEEDQE
ncbi:hypothetical protein HOB30_00525, partial [Candidatus Falkowbacteria bacterium]|nr:hypothetical protein [Candidatus Falkowbacteria bacterium]